MRSFMRFWNLKPLGVVSASILVSKAALSVLLDKLSTLLWSYNVGSFGKRTKVQRGCSFRYPASISFGDGVTIGKFVSADSELFDSLMVVGAGSQINRNVSLDFTGDLFIGSNVVVSDSVKVITHDHGVDPHAPPKKAKKVIEDGVWIGSCSIILPQAHIIGKGSIVAAGSVVTKDVPPKCIVGGNPARVIRQLEV